MVVQVTLPSQFFTHLVVVWAWAAKDSSKAAIVIRVFTVTP